MNVVDRFTLRSMMKNKKWTAVTLIGIIISTAMLSAVSTLTASFQHLLVTETAEAYGDWHAMVEDVPGEKVSAFEEAAFTGKVFLTKDLGYSRLPGAKGKFFLFALGADSQGLTSLPIRLLEGRMPANSTEIALPKHLLMSGDWRCSVGDRIALDFGSRVAPSGAVLWQGSPYMWASPDSPGETWISGESRSYTVVGIIEPYGLEPGYAAGYTCVTFLDRGEVEPGDTVTVSVTAKKVKKNFHRQMETFVDSIGLAGRPIRYNQELLAFQGVVANDSAQNSMYSLAVVVIAIIMVASVSLIYNAFAISVTERVSQLGMLGSVGATGRQKRRSVYYEGFLLGVVGIPLGNLFGILGIAVTLSAMRPIFQTLTDVSSSAWSLELHVSPVSIGITSALAAVAIAVSAWLPARRASLITPIEAIRRTKDFEVSRKAVKTPRLVRWIFGLEGDLALKNLGRDKKKRRATVLSLIISLVLFLTVSYLADEIKMGSKIMEMGFNFDVALHYRGFSRQEAADITERVTALSGVDRWTEAEMGYGQLWVGPGELSSFIRERVKGEDVPFMSTLEATFYCIDDASLEAYACELGLNPDEFMDAENPKAILVNYGQSVIGGKVVAGEILSINPGAALRFSAGDNPEKGFDLTLGALTDKRPMGVPISGLNSVFVVVSRQVFSRFPDSVKSIDAGGNPSQQILVLNCEDPFLLESKIYEVGYEPGGTGGSILVNVTAKTARMERDLMFVVGVFTYGFIILISLICIANILNTVTTSIALRRREFAMLRSVGMTPGSFAKMLRYESVFYGAEALLYGLPLGAGLSYFLYRAVQGGFEFGFHLPWPSYLAAVSLVFVIVGVAMIWSSARVRGENIADALKADYL